MFRKSKSSPLSRPQNRRWLSTEQLEARRLLASSICAEPTADFADNLQWVGSNSAVPPVALTPRDDASSNTGAADAPDMPNVADTDAAMASESNWSPMLRIKELFDDMAFPGTGGQLIGNKAVPAGGGMAAGNNAGANVQGNPPAPDTALPEPVKPVDLSKFTPEERQAYRDMLAALEKMKKAKADYDKATQDVPAGANAQTLEDLRKRKAELEAEIAALKAEAQQHTDAANQSNQDLANEYNQQHAEEIQKAKDDFIKAKEAWEGSGGDLEKLQAMKAARARLEQVAPGERFAVIDGQYFWSTSSAGMKERAERQRQFHKDQSAAANAAATAKQTELDGICKQIAALAAQQAANDAAKCYQMAKEQFEAASAKVQAANDRIAHAQAVERLNNAIQNFIRKSRTLREKIAEYEGRQIAISTLGRFFQFLSKLAGQLPENPDPTNALQFGGQLLEAAGRFLFPSLDSLPRDKNGDYVLGESGDIQLHEVVEAANAVRQAERELQAAINAVKGK